jgi:hypothetical protein
MEGGSLAEGLLETLSSCLTGLASWLSALSRSGSEIVFCFSHFDVLSCAYVRMNVACYMSVSDVSSIPRIDMFARTRTSFDTEGERHMVE